MYICRLDEDRPRRNIGKFFGLGSDLQEEVQTQLKRCKESVQLLEGENKQKMLDMLKVRVAHFRFKLSLYIKL